MLRKFDRNAKLNAIAGFAIAYGMASWVCFISLFMFWSSMAPVGPDPANGLIFLNNVHGSITYFSAFQVTSCAILFYTCPLIWIIACAIVPKKDVVVRTGRLSYYATWRPDDPQKTGRWGMAAGTICAPLFIFTVGPYLVRSLNAAGVVIGF
jgi:hypothetical protein